MKSISFRLGLCRLAIGLSSLLAALTPLAPATTIGQDDPGCTCVCSCACNCPGATISSSFTSSSTSSSAGNLTETVPVATVGDPTIALSLTYNSYNADGSRAVIDTVLGYGWTHSYNVFLFTQLGSMFRFDGDGRVTRYKLGPGGSFAAAAGYFETLVKNPNGTFTLTKKDRTMYTFASIPGSPILVAGPVWQLTSIVDRNGNTTTLTYSDGNLTAITDTYGRVVTLSYNALNKLASVTDPAGRTTTFQYDASGHMLTQITDPNGNSVRYSYNTLYQLAAKTDKAGRSFAYVYNSGHKPIAVNDAGGASVSVLSNPNNWATDPTQLAAVQSRVYLPSTTSNKDGRGNVWKYTYDSHGYIVREVAPDGATTSYVYDPVTLMLASKTDANGNTTSYLYDARGNRTEMIDALGHITKYTYDSDFSIMTSETDPRGRTSTWVIDPANGNLIREIDPLGQVNTRSYDNHGNVLSLTDKNGHTTTWQYDAFGEPVKIIDPLGNVTTMTRDSVGNMLSRTDANSHTTKYQYDGLNRLIQQTDALGHVAQAFYDGEGNRIRTVDRNAHSTFFQYDLRQRLVKTTDALGQSETNTYDANDNLTSWTDRNGHTSAYGYDVRNRPIAITDALGNISSTTYDAVGNRLTATDANGHVATSTWDALNRRLTMADAADEITSYQYDTGTLSSCASCGVTPGSHLITAQTDANGKVTYFKFDAINRKIAAIAKVGSTLDTITAADAVRLTTWDPVGNRLTNTEPNGNTATWVYDADNRVVSEADAAGDKTATSYDGVGNVIAVTAPNTNVTTNTFDALNRLIKTSDSAGVVSGYAYDAVGNLLSLTDGNGNTTQYSYDALDRLVLTTDPLGNSAASQYDPVGNVKVKTDRDGNTTVWSYDAINRRISTTDALRNTTQWQYDGVGNLTRLTDADLHSALYAYDPVDRRISETLADGTARNFTWDAVGNLQTRTDQNGRMTQYGYNDLYFLLSRTYPSAVNDVFSYDLSGRMLTASRGAWVVTFAYDGGDRVTQTSQNGQLVSYAYNIPGRTRTLTYPGGRAITEHTDARKRIDNIADVGSGAVIVKYAYDSGNRVTGRSYLNGTNAAYSYDADDRTLSVQHSFGPVPIAGFSYTYDQEGNKQDEQRLNDLTHSEAYQYDATYRLITYTVGTLVGSVVPVPITQTSYALDPVGNWNSKLTNGVLQTRIHNSTNELIDIDSSPITYDANGNTLGDGVFAYAWDEENRLTKVTRKSDSAVIGEYQYDALGRRVQKIARPAAVPVTTRYCYDETRIVEEQDGAALTRATYVYGNYVDEVLTMTRGGQTYYSHQNSQWSAEAVTNSAGTPVERYAYDAYGMVTVTDGAGLPVAGTAWGVPHSAIGNPFLFTGRELDEESGLYYYRARHYDSLKGRFLQRDPAGFSDGTNLYEYVHGAPVMRLDPTGEEQKLGSESVKPPDQGANDEKPPKRYCGAYLIATKWTFTENSLKGGFVIQHITVKGKWDGCKECGMQGHETPVDDDYYEAWEVAATTNKIIDADSFKNGGNDGWAQEEIGCCTEGKYVITGDATFYEGYALPAGFVRHNKDVTGGSNKLRSQLKAPEDLPAATNHITRKATISWNCCKDGEKCKQIKDGPISGITDQIKKRHETEIEKDF